MRADGSEFPVELAINRIGGAEPPMFTGTVRDITDRRRAEEEREELLRLEQLARLDADPGARPARRRSSAASPTRVTAQAPDGRLLFANDAAARAARLRVDRGAAGAPGDWIRRPLRHPRRGRRAASRRAAARPAGARRRGRRRGGRALPRARDRRGALVGRQGDADPRRRRPRDDGDQRDRGHHRRTSAPSARSASWPTAARVLGASLDPDEVLGQVASLAVPEVADWVAVDMPGDSGIERVALAHRDPRAPRAGRGARPRATHADRDAPRGVANVLRTGQSELYPDIPRAPAARPTTSARAPSTSASFGMRSAMIVPMIARGRTLGALTLATDQSGRRFDEHDLELAEELAPALRHGGRQRPPVHRARATSRARCSRACCRPSCPTSPASRRRPASGRPARATRSAATSTTCSRAARRGWTVVIGDVCGKGPDAAAVTALARYTLRAAAMRERLPSRSLRSAQRGAAAPARRPALLHGRLRVPRAARRRARGSASPAAATRCRCCCAPDGTVEPVGAPGTLLGVVPDPSFEDASLVAGARRRARLLHRRRDRGPRGAARRSTRTAWRELVAACAGAGADAIAARVEDAAVAAQDGSPRDDIAVLVLRVAR